MMKSNKGLSNSGHTDMTHYLTRFKPGADVLKKT